MPNGLNKNIQTDQTPGNHGLTVNSICSFCQLTGIWGVVPPRNKTFETTGFMIIVLIHSKLERNKIILQKQQYNFDFHNGTSKNSNESAKY